MRFGCLFSGLFWGVLLIVLGGLLLVNSLFGISLPVFPILLSLLLVYIGIQLILGPRWFARRTGPHLRWEHRTTAAGDRHEVIFGQSHLDLYQLTSVEANRDIVLDVVFGSCTVRLNPDMPARIYSSVAFGAVHLPDGTMTAFGESVWQTPGLDENQPCLTLHISCAFGSVRVATG